MLASCVGEPTEAPQPSVTPTAASSPAPTSSPTLGPGPSPVTTPETRPHTFGPDVPEQEIPSAALIPVGATATGEWFAFTDHGVMIVVAWAEPGEEITHVPRGIAVWRHAAADPHWRVAWMQERRASAGVSEIVVTAADVTADGSDDVVIFEGTSGSGGCGWWIVLDLLDVERIFARHLCDARIEAGPAGAPGLIVTESVFEPGDSHCCPSAIRRTTLAWTGSRWRVTDRIETAA